MKEKNQLIEQGVFEKDLYGSAFASVEQVMKLGKICVLNLHAEVSFYLGVAAVQQQQLVCFRKLVTLTCCLAAFVSCKIIFKFF